MEKGRGQAGSDFEGTIYPIEKKKQMGATVTVVVVVEAS